MSYVSPDNRDEYPVHLFNKKRSPGKNKESKRLFYECRVYDKFGKLLRIEMRPPIDFLNETIDLSSFDHLFTGYIGPGNVKNFIKGKEE